MPKLTSSGAVAKHDDASSAELTTADEKKIDGLVAWLRSDMGVKVTSSEQESDDVEFVKKILILHKMNVRRSQRFLVKYFKARSKDGSDFFKQRSAESDEILKSCQSVYFFTLPEGTQDGHKVSYVRLFPDLQAEDFDPKSFFRRFFMLSDIRLKEENSCDGDIFLVDLEGFTTLHAVKIFSNGLLQRFIKCLKETYPRRLQAVFLLNSKPWQRRALRMCMKMTRAGRRNGAKISYDASFPCNLTPANLQDFNDIWTRRMISHASWLEALETKQSPFVPKKVHIDKQDDDSDSELTKSRRKEIYTFQHLEGAFRQLQTEDF